MTNSFSGNTEIRAKSGRQVNTPPSWHAAPLFTFPLRRSSLPLTLSTLLISSLINATFYRTLFHLTHTYTVLPYNCQFSHELNQCDMIT